MIVSEQFVDNRGLACPQPVIHTKKVLDAMTEGIVVSVVDNETAKENVSRLAASLGCSCEIEEKEGLFYLRITKNAADAAASASAVTTAAVVSPQLYNENGRLIFIGSAQLGDGAEELGGILMKSFLYTVCQADDLLPKVIVLVNSGVQLALPEAASFGHLKELEQKGVEIICCGTCLDYYGLMERYQVGRVGNMYEIYELLSNHDVLKV